MLVQRLDRIDSFYYIVPFTDDRGEARTAVSVDARFGDYRQAITAGESGFSLSIALDEKVIRELTINRLLELGRRQGRVRIRKEAFCLYPTMVWEPCRESLSPFYPFHMITIGEHRIYVRSDAKVFTKLHTFIPGI